MSDKPNFQSMLTKLEELVVKLEQPGNSLEESLAGYERGMRLVAECQKELQAAKQRVELVSKRVDEISITEVDLQNDD